MNQKTKSQIFISIFVTVLVAFGGGYLAGTHSFSFTQFDAEASERADMRAFWKVWDMLDQKYVSSTTTDPISSEVRMQGAIKGLVDSLGDPYTVFLTPEEKTNFDESITGLFDGIGMEVGIRDNMITVVAPLKNSPSEKAGLRSGDKIIKIDGVDSIKMSTDEAISLIRGPKGTVVVLEVAREGEAAPLKISVTRDTIVIPTIETEIKDDVFIIRLYSFGASATTEFKTALRQYVASQKSKLILDLRGNPGGYLDAAVDITSWFLPAGKPIVLEDFGTGQTQKIFRSKGYNVFDPKDKMIILIDQGSASASEIVAGALQEHGVAQLVGMQSFGKGSVQELVDITPTTALKVTIAQWLTPQGKSISDGGLVPNVEIKFDPELYREQDRDTQLEKALELLK